MWAGDWVNLLLSAQLAQATQWIWIQLIFEEIALGSHSLPQASDSNLDDKQIKLTVTKIQEKSHHLFFSLKHFYD